ncbi:branched-chain amino acid transport system substrate-binding protein [Chitinivorax tropicus]|uniref:Branched-chain amino acid transport system substrate-binding protein n=1 Tax=Chitinivorax tropicus TaxID=714531 RepID=A0A840MNS3_9PROT|nr:ABC transporter substrate-binding protein [Chitinivorax tropicus]MBB5018657.1 branched-chain amino acid transport system substrate-binding protein [Chitinivorax tropicus]
MAIMHLKKLVVATGVALMSTWTCGAGISDDVVRIGVLTDMSGVYADVGGKGAVTAAQMAAKDFGGKVLGKRIEIISADHKNELDDAMAIAKTWDLQRPRVDMVTELMNSQVAIGVSKYFSERGVVSIKTGASTSALTNDACSRLAVDWVYDAYAASHGLLKELIADGVKSFSVMATDYGDKTDKATANDIFLAAMAARKAGGKVYAPFVKTPPSNVDFTPYLLKMQESGAQGMVFAVAGGDFVNAVKQAREFGLFGPEQELIGMVVFDSDVKALGLDVAQGMKFIAGFYWDRDNETREFAKRFFALTKKMPTSSQAGVYSGVLHYLRGVQAAGTDEGNAVMDKMRATKINDFFAKDGYIREDGRMMHDMYLMEVKKPLESKGEAQWDLLRIKRALKADNVFKPLAQSTCPLVKK